MKKFNWLAIIAAIGVMLLSMGSAHAQEMFPPPPKTRVLQTQVNWNSKLLASPGLSECNVSARKGGTSSGSEPSLTAAGGGNFVLTVQTQEATQVLVTCVTPGNTSPLGLVDGDGKHRPIGHAIWYCPGGNCVAVDSTGTTRRVDAIAVRNRETTTILWSAKGHSTESIHILWVLHTAKAAKAVALAKKAWQRSGKALKTATRANATANSAKATANSANATANSVKATAVAITHDSLSDERKFSLRLAYTRSLDTANEPARSGFEVGVEGYVANLLPSLKLSIGAILARSQVAVPVLNAPNLTVPNSYVSGSRTFLGPSIGVDWVPGANFVFDARSSLGVGVWENGTAVLSQTMNGSVFISPTSTDRPISGRVEASASYAIGGIVPVGMGISMTRNLAKAQTFRGFDFPGYTVPEGNLTDVDMNIHVGFIY